MLQYFEPSIKVNKPRLNLLKKYWEKIIINYWLRKVNIDTVNWQELYDGSAEPQLMQYTVTP